ncbi:DUF4167 domain-containing protein [Brevundimonas vesicularis]|uniref:DUF4167 domain-containing protein n=1 Tax=Brevundimonas vesicularis TaxID=41276 RepID=UPI0022AC5AF4|nr:DUF4167 domain-containing protein [Brevundimonas vesicularis]
MRDFKGMKRQRGRNRNKAGANNANNANPNRSWDSQGPENIKVRGNAQTVYERYQQLARDAASSGDRVLAENYQQHAEHYYRVLRALQPQRSFSDIAAREQSNQGFDIDFEDESGAQAAAFVAAQQAADRQAAEAAERAEQNQNRDQNRDRDYSRDRDRDRDNRDRDHNRDRDQNRDGQQPREPREPREGDEVRAEGEGGGRRESRRERWERRREERNRRFDNQDGAQDGAEGAAPSYAEADRAEAVSEAPVVETPVNVADAPSVEALTADERPARRPRRTAAAVAADDGDAPTALPGFLTRAPVSSTPAEQAEGEAAPRRRAPRRKPEAATASED